MKACEVGCGYGLPKLLCRVRPLSSSQRTSSSVTRAPTFQDHRNIIKDPAHSGIPNIEDPEPDCEILTLIHVVFGALRYDSKTASWIPRAGGAAAGPSAQAGCQRSRRWLGPISKHEHKHPQQPPPTAL